MKYDEVTISRQLETSVPVYVPDMSTPIGRLKHLRHVVEGVPESAFDMGVIAESMPCGTVGCMLGHAALDPVFNAIGLRLMPTGARTSTALFRRDDDGSDYHLTGAAFLGVTRPQASGLFTCDPQLRYGEGRPITKAYGIARIDRLIAELSV